VLKRFFVARSIRIEHPGAFYHVMAKGNRREAIFRSDQDRQLFLKTLGELRQRLSFCLDNLDTFLVETPFVSLCLSN
jgi:REP-associated tyrosine transposase